MQNWTLEQIAGALAFIVALGAGIKYILAPVIQYQSRQKSIDDKFEDIDGKLDNDNRRLLTLENDTKQILRAVNALLGHAMDNNHTGEVANAKKLLDEYLIGR
jgi:hypothetical protein